MTKAEFREQIRWAERDSWNRAVRKAINMVMKLPDPKTVEWAVILLQLKLDLDKMVKKVPKGRG